MGLWSYCDVLFRRTIVIATRRKFLVRLLLGAVVLVTLYFAFNLRSNEYYINDLYGYASSLEEWQAKAKVSNFCVPTGEMDARYTGLARRVLPGKEDYIVIGSNWKDCERLAYDF